MRTVPKRAFCVGAAVLAAIQLRLQLFGTPARGGSGSKRGDSSSSSSQQPRELPSGPGGGFCRFDEDCQLNGICSRKDGNKCVCDAAWAGPTCTTLRLLPASPSDFTAQPAYPPPDLLNTTSSWGGSVIRDRKDRGGDGNYHMFVSEFAGSCGLESWATASQVVHAVADTPKGPFQRVDVTIGNFSHNPIINYDTHSRQYVLHHIGCGTANKGSAECQCRGGKTKTDCRPPQQVSCSRGTTHVMYSERPSGPWTSKNVTVEKSKRGGRPPRMGKFGVDNPAPWFEEDGSIIMLGRCDWTSIGTISAASASSKLVLGKQIGLAQEPWPSKWPRLRSQDRRRQYKLSNDVEDAHIWKDKRGRYHALMHGGPQPPPAGFVDVGYHAFSVDGQEWAFSEKPAFQSAVKTTDGRSIRFRRRERPHLLLDSQRQPTHLYHPASS